MGNSPGMMIDPNGEMFNPFVENNVMEQQSEMEQSIRNEKGSRKTFFGLNALNTLMAAGGGGGNIMGTVHSGANAVLALGKSMMKVFNGLRSLFDRSEIQTANTVSGNNYNSGSISPVDNVQPNDESDKDRPFGTSYDKIERKVLPIGQDPWVNENKLKNSDGQRVYTLQEFVEYNEGLSYEDIINQRPKSSGQAGGPLMRYVINPKDGNLMDMRHVLVVGYGKGMIVGHTVEFFQLFTPQTYPSAMNPQDFYSNRIGTDFHWFSITPHARNIGGFANRFNDFILYHAKSYYSSTP